MLIQFGLGTLLAIIISVSAWRLHLLNVSGMIAAGIMGMVVFGLGGLPWASLLIGFFVLSSLLSRLARKRKAHLDEKYAKGSQRDAWQVIANGGVATIILVITTFQREVLGCSDTCFAANGWAFLAFAGSLAAANADTWATELGVLSRDNTALDHHRSQGAIWHLRRHLSDRQPGCPGRRCCSSPVLAALPWVGFPHPLEWPMVRSAGHCCRIDRQLHRFSAWAQPSRRSIIVQTARRKPRNIHYMLAVHPPGR